MACTSTGARSTGCVAHPPASRASAGQRWSGPSARPRRCATSPRSGGWRRSIRLA